MRRTILVIEYILMFVFIGMFLVGQQYSEALFAAISLCFGLLPIITQELTKIRLPTHAVWVLPTLFLVNAIGIYFNIPLMLPHFDKFLHFSGGAVLVIFIYQSVSRIKNTKENSKLFLLIFAIALAVALGAFWEVYEWFMTVVVHDAFFTMTLADTVGDLIADTAGALVVAIIYFFR